MNQTAISQSVPGAHSAVTSRGKVTKGQHIHFLAFELAKVAKKNND